MQKVDIEIVRYPRPVLNNKMFDQTRTVFHKIGGVLWAAPVKRLKEVVEDAES